ncbi:MAG: energy-coupled thiamine transporter ThiT [Lachnospiraceae bacterium]|jgi:thiamine transporter|nr:energy-coupled thiamine transporter ThiT [Lachnospiraceae bacterium]
MSKRSTAKTLVFSAAAVALATVIATVLKLPSLPFGGSITLFSMLFICLVGYWYGPAVGLTASVSFGILQFITGPYIVHPLQVLLDYPLAFGALGLSGFFHNRKHGLLLGYIAGVAGRFFFHEISGFIFYTEYAGNLKGDLLAVWASTAYNLSYLLPEMLITIILLALRPVEKALARVKQLAAE